MQSNIEESTEDGSKRKGRNLEHRAQESRIKVKAIQIGLAAALGPMLVRELSSVARPLADGLGFALAQLAVYWIPPIWRLGFGKWILLSIGGSVLVTLFSLLTAH